jgi:hypothetical protein
MTAIATFVGYFVIGVILSRWILLLIWYLVVKDKK